jgi:hypothetical protein
MAEVEMQNKEIPVKTKLYEFRTRIIQMFYRIFLSITDLVFFCFVRITYKKNVNCSDGNFLDLLDLNGDFIMQDCVKNQVC